MEPAKREDFPEEVADELEAYLKEMFPGMEVKFLGDNPDVELPPRIVAGMDQLEAKMEETLMNGLCYDCGKKIPGEWPPTESGPLPEGWGYFSTPSGEPMFLVCPECDVDADEVQLEELE